MEAKSKKHDEAVDDTEESFTQDVNSANWAGRGDCQPFLRMPELML